MTSVNENNTPSKAFRIELSCPECGNTGWIHRDDGFECAACGTFSYTEDMCAKVNESQNELKN